MSSHSLLATAVDAVRRAGAIHLARVDAGFQVTRKGVNDVVTDVDLEAEAMFRAMVAERFPEHSVLAEEMAETLPPSHGTLHRWLFDPLDGTANYARGVPFFCASLALEVSGVIEIAAVYDPTRNELFTAELGRGAWLNGQPITVSQTSRVAEGLLGSGFPHGATSRDPEMERFFAECAIRARAVRRLGSAALDLCYVACGRMDGFWDKNLKPWDTAAGALIVTEASGEITALDGGRFDPYRGNVLASNRRLHREIIDILFAR